MPTFPKTHTNPAPPPKKKKHHRNLAVYKLYDFKNSGILMKNALDEAQAEEAAETVGKK